MESRLPSPGRVSGRKLLQGLRIAQRWKIHGVTPSIQGLHYLIPKWSQIWRQGWSVEFLNLERIHVYVEWMEIVLGRSDRPLRHALHRHSDKTFTIIKRTVIDGELR